MKIECLREKLVNAVAKVEKVTGKNISLPVLTCILLEVKDQTLKLKATNLDLGIEVSIPVKMEREGVVAVPGAILSNFISNLQNEKSIHLELIDDNLKITAESTQTIIKTLPVDDFPTIPQIADGDVFKIGINDWLKGLKSVIYSASITSIKPELASIYIYTNEENLVFVATDSFRLAEKKIKLKKKVEISSLLIPFKNVSDLIRIIDDSKEEVEISFTKNQISFSYNSTYIVSRIIDGVFPDYRQIIPKDHKTEVIILKQDLIGALKISNIFSDSFNQININVVPEKKTFELKTKNSNVGETINKLIASLAGEEINVNFNYKYIIDSFQSIDSDSISLQFNGLNRPLVIGGVSDKSFLYIVMPMNK